MQIRTGEFLGHQIGIAEERVKREGEYFFYDLIHHSENICIPCSIESREVLVNFFGTIISKNPLNSILNEDTWSGRCRNLSSEEAYMLRDILENGKVNKL